MKIKDNIETLAKDELKEITNECLDIMKDFIKSSYKLLSRKREYDPYSLDCFSKINETYFAEREKFIKTCKTKEEQDKCRQLTYVESDLGEELLECVPSNNIIDTAKDTLSKNPDCESIHHLVYTLKKVVYDFMDVFVHLLFNHSYKDTYSFNENGELIQNEIPSYSFDAQTLTLKRDNNNIASFSYIEADKEIVTSKIHTEDSVDLYYIRFYFSDLLILYMQYQKLKFRISELNTNADEIYQTYMECKQD